MRLRPKPVHPVTLISVRIDRAITPGEARFLDAHMPSCESCQRQDASLREICDMLESQPVPAPPPDAIKRLLESLGEVEPPQPEVVEPMADSQAPRNTGKPWILIVAVLLLLVSAGVINGTRRQPPAPPADASHREVPSYPTSPLEIPTRSCPVSSPEPTGQPTAKVEVIEPPARSSKRPSTPRSGTAELQPPAVVKETVAAVNPAPPLVAVQRDAAPPAEPAPSAAETFETSSIRFGGNGKSLNRESRRTLDELAKWMRSRDDVRLAIESHTSPRKSSKKTLELGRKRANAVARYLQKQGIDPSRLSREARENDDPGTSQDRVDLIPGH